MTEKGTSAAEPREAFQPDLYGTFVAWGRATGHGEVAALLHRTLDEGRVADEELFEPAEGGIEQSGADSSQAGDEGEDNDEDDEDESDDDEDDEDDEDEDDDEDDEEEAGTRPSGSGAQMSSGTKPNPAVFNA